MPIGDAALEAIRAVVVAVILLLVVLLGRRHGLMSLSGWKAVTAGFALILLGCIADITDEFKGLARFVVIGPTATEAFIEKVVGFLGGFVLIAWALWRFHPVITAARQSEVSLRSSLDVAERQLAETANMLEAMTRHSFLMVCIHREKLLYANRVLSDFLGYTPSELLGMKMHDLVHPSQRSMLDRELEEDLSSVDSPPHKHVLWLLAKDGRECWVQMTSMRTKFDGGLARFCVAIDITEQKALSRQLQAAQKKESIGLMAGGIAHDFNNYLTTLLGNIGVMNMLQQSPREQKLLKLMEEACFSATDMVRQLLGFSRQNASTDQSALDAAAIVRGTLKLARVSIPESTRLESDIDEGALPIYGDASQLQQALLNLLLNARDACEGAEDPLIRVRLDSIRASELLKPLPAVKKEGRVCRITIQDNGCGIKPEHLEHIFEPFFTTKGAMQGTGLGLAMVYGAIQQHQGFIEVESTPGEGSTFALLLPQLAASDARLQQATFLAESQAVKQGNQETVLLVDDNALVRQTTRNVLESLGYTAFEAENGAQALQLFTLHKDEIDLLVSDIVMPVMDGVKLANEVQKLHPRLPVILATGYDRDAYLANLENREQIKLISKPYRVGDLAGLIRKMLDG